MNQNPIDKVLDELRLTDSQREGFWEFIKYAKTCQETNNNKALKNQLNEVIKKVTSKSM